MPTFHHAHAHFFSGSQYDITADLFPQQIEDPEAAIERIEAAVYRGTNFHRKLTYYRTPAFPEFKIPAMHQYLGSGIKVVYI